MSFDLAVFSPDAAPRDREAFMTWYHEQMKWAGPKDYGDPSSLNPDLLSFFTAMVEEFPAMNGPLAKRVPDDEDPVPRTTDYCGADAFLYMAFAWSVAEDAYEFVRETARATGVGFFDASDDEAEPEFPLEPELTEATQPKKRGFLRRLLGRQA